MRGTIDGNIYSHHQNIIPIREKKMLIATSLLYSGTQKDNELKICTRIKYKPLNKGRIQFAILIEA